jgi:hypothetical protein
MHYHFWSLVPPLIAIILAIRSRQVFLSLGFGIWLGWLIIALCPALRRADSPLLSVIGISFQDFVAGVLVRCKECRLPANRGSHLQALAKRKRYLRSLKC